MVNLHRLICFMYAFLPAGGDLSRGGFCLPHRWRKPTTSEKAPCQNKASLQQEKPPSKHPNAPPSSLIISEFQNILIYGQKPPRESNNKLFFECNISGGAVPHRMGRSRGRGSLLCMKW